MDTNSLRYTAIIPTLGRPKTCLTCVNSMLAQTRAFDEIIVVEANSQLSSLSNDLAKLGHPSTKIYYVASKRVGLTYQRNLGITKANGEIIFFTDDDTTLDPDCLEIIDSVYQALGSKAGGIQPRIIQNDKTPRFSTFFRLFFLLSDFTDTSIPRMKPSGFPSLAGSLSKAVPAEVFCGVASFRREIFDHFHYDEQLTGYGAMEDVDFSYRVSKKYPLRIEPAAKVYHHHEFGGRDTIADQYMMGIRNYRYIFNKNMPQNIYHKMAYNWAMLGMIFFALINSFRWKTNEPWIGILKGIFANYPKTLP